MGTKCTVISSSLSLAFHPMIIWIFRGYPKYVGFPMDLQISWIHGYPRIFSICEEINGYLWQSMAIYRNLWQSMEIRNMHRYPKIANIPMQFSMTRKSHPTTKLCEIVDPMEL